MFSKSSVLLICSLALVLIGSSLANYVNTGGGRVEISDLRFATSNGGVMSALLYKPKSASAQSPAPGVLAIHGYINSRETQSGFAIELARRGFVVLAIDQSGHGYTSPPAFANAFGSVDGLKYLRSLSFVDTNRIGLEGHSMGGWASRAATQLMPDAYHSIVMVGSSTSPLVFGDFSGSPSDPKNIAIVYSLYDEFSQMMWQGTLPQDLPNAPLLKQMFGTEETVVTEKLYGSIADGTARKYYQPATTHPGDHISPEAILNAVEWLQLTLNHDSDVGPEEHIFLWKEWGTLIALIGIVLAIFPLCQLMMNLPVFLPLQGSTPANFSEGGALWWLGALLTTAIPAATFFWFYDLTAATIPASALWPQNVTTAITGWAILNLLITVLVLGASFWLRGKKQGMTLEHFGLDLPAKEIIRTALLAALVTAILAAIAAAVDGVFNSDFRFWVVALKPMSWPQWQIFFAYLPLFTLFFIGLSANLAGALRRSNTEGHEQSLFAAIATNAAVLATGFLVLLIIQYATLFQTGSLLIDQALTTIIALQFVPLLIIIACISTYCFRLTGRVYLGAFVNALFVTWYIVAGQATHFAS